ncbi:helix-turn-helix transcriptional regulator [Kaistella jeonii]|uniref:Uncharacterized protein n=1 Tax=Kaistella jeonii TaxID=266749 RepID=A0A0C1D6W1_9FLAO|nr:WYL domain-containing protein [Kaistella jeonii]KIA89605.1 hypothetical protein OA86_02940 [Kaistella jeonii]SFB90109.1 Predicted DNA-binding transcriptional regulator YafY, contains an HTH and WYL domains [Kaistella jeonii]VEI95815.1 Uncharacterised protein [Kaistella jeonii]
MASNKNAVIRYKALDKCFSNAFKKFYINDLIEYCSNILTEYYAQDTTVSRRQIFDDIDFMKSEAGYDAPIESIKDGRKVFYRYSDLDFSILKKPLNASELSTLNQALETLSRMNNIPGFDWVNTIQTKLNSGLKLKKEENQIISFEENEFLKGVEFLNPLYQYIVNKQCLDITYKSFSSDHEKVFTVSPFYLKQYNNRWFLFGHNHEVEKIQNLALDRIIEIKNSKTEFEESSIDFEEYFEDIIGVSNDQDAEVVSIVIELSDNILPYVKSKPVHGSQKINGNVLQLKVKINYELTSLILSYGENMKIVKPRELVEKLKVRISNLKSFY